MLIRILLVVVTLVLISGEIRDYYERAIALRSGEVESATLDLENLKQMFLSTGWLVYSIGLMGVGLLRRERTVRIIAIVLFGIAILKIFFYDLSFLETLYRIVSFIGLGIILMTVSYLYQRLPGADSGRCTSSRKALVDTLRNIRQEIACSSVTMLLPLQQRKRRPARRWGLCSLRRNFLTCSGRSWCLRD